MLYVCLNCGAVLDEDELKVCISQIGGEYPYVWDETYNTCPHCSSDKLKKYYGCLESGENVKEYIESIISEGGFEYDERFDTYSKYDENGNEVCYVENDGTVTRYGNFIGEDSYSLTVNDGTEEYYIHDKIVSKEAFFAYAETHTDRNGGG